MKEDSSLFKYELAIVAILKCEAPYVKEWLDYHLLAGVDHFYLYDNESPDNLKQVLQPYIDAEVVDYTFMPGQCAQMLAYNDAVNKHKFDCRYLAFLDGDEFMLPRNNQTVKDVLRQTINDKPNAAALAVSWHIFGSGGHEKADLSQGVLDRFTYRTPDNFEVDKTYGNGHVKTIANPRCIDVLMLPHCAIYYPGKVAVDENGKHVAAWFNPDVPDKKIIINHYSTKSKEEYSNKLVRGQADAPVNLYKMDAFYNIDKDSGVFDNDILKYRQYRFDQLSDSNEELTLQFESSRMINNRRFNAVVQHVLPQTMNFASNELFGGKLHEFLTCRAVSHSLKVEKALDETTAEFFEELSLRCAYRSLSAGELEMWQLLLLLDELPKILLLEYDVIDDIQNACRQLIPQMLMHYRIHTDWNKYKQFNYLLQMVESNLQ